MSFFSSFFLFSKLNIVQHSNLGSGSPDFRSVSVTINRNKVLNPRSLRIDTSDWGVNFRALFHKVWISCFRGL